MPPAVLGQDMMFLSSTNFARCDKVRSRNSTNYQILIYTSLTENTINTTFTMMINVLNVNHLVQTALLCCLLTAPQFVKTGIWNSSGVIWSNLLFLKHNTTPELPGSESLFVGQTWMNCHSFSTCFGVICRLLATGLFHYMRQNDLLPTNFHTDFWHLPESPDSGK